MLPRHQPEPRGEIAPLRKRRAVADGGDEGSRRERADARHLHEPIAGLIVTREAEDFLIDVFNVVVQEPPLVAELLEQPTEADREAQRGIVEHLGEPLDERLSPDRTRDAALE